MHKLHISIPEQTLVHTLDGHKVHQYLICTATNGAGEIINSEQTPRGLHYIRAKIGDGLPINSVLKSRRPTGQILNDDVYLKNTDKDWILTRIMWLCGLEKGKNRSGNCDTMRRYIYIHGSPDRKPMGIPSSKGCINMRNEDIVQLFDHVPVGTEVYIEG